MSNLQTRIDQLTLAANDIDKALELVKSEENIEQIKKFLTTSREYFKCRADSLVRTRDFMLKRQEVPPPTVELEKAQECHYCAKPATLFNKQNHPICAKCNELTQKGFTFCIDCDNYADGWCQKHHQHAPATFYAKCLFA